MQTVEELTQKVLDHLTENDKNEFLAEYSDANDMSDEDQDLVAEKAANRLKNLLENLNLLDNYQNLDDENRSQFISLFFTGLPAPKDGDCN